MPFSVGAMTWLGEHCVFVVEEHMPGVLAVL